MPTVTKKDLVQEVSRHNSLTQVQVAEALDLLTEIISNYLKAGDDVAIRGFGSFRIRSVPSRIGRNPNRPSESIQIPEHCVVKFRPCPSLREGIRGTDLSRISKKDSTAF